MPSWIGSALLVALVLFALYRRFRSLFGRQPVRPAPIVLRTTLLLGVATVMLVASGPSLWALFFGILGFGTGFGCALYSLSKTRFETNAEGRFYTPDPYVGLAVTGVFLARLLWRMTTSNPMFGPGHQYESVLSTAITVGVFFLIASYYVVFGGGVLYSSPKAPDLSPL